MGEKVNFNRKSNSNKNSFKKFIIIAIIILLVLLMVVGLLKAYKTYSPNVTDNQLHYNVSEFNSLQELLSAYDTAYIRTDDSGDILKIYVSFSKDLYTGTEGNRNYFWGVATAVADYQKFENFQLIDLVREIEIEVICQDENIVEFKINGDKNYYLNKDSEINSGKKDAKVTSFTIQSEILEEVIDNEWSDSKINFGSQESTAKSYNIYFDEGIKYKKVGSKIFNLIFTSNYKYEVAGGLTTVSTAEDVKNALGTPTFSDGTTLYGYKSKDNYLFFNFKNQEISVYPIQSISDEDEEDFIELINEMNKTNDVKTFVTKITDLWSDYDEYTYNSDYVNLKYTLKGIELEISSSSLENGLFIYQNYSGKENIQDLENVYVEGEDIVFETEKSRIYSDMLNRVEQGEHVSSDMSEYGIEFSVRFQGELASNEEGYKGAVFYSRDRSYPDSELDRTLVISSYNWYDDYKIVYSVDNEGIFVYNCRTRVSAKILELDEKIIINEASNGKITYNDDKVISVNID